MGGGEGGGGVASIGLAGAGTIAGLGSSSTAAAIPEDHNQRKQNHCEIEKRRRDKMNHYIMELASVLPPFSNNHSKLDKLTVLRMAVQHVKSLRSSLCSFSSFHLRPSFLSSGDVLKNLILQMASQEAQDNLFMVVTCDRGKVLFVSKSSKNILNQDQDELVGQSLFDILHKDDVSKVKEQISYFNLVPKELVVDSRTLQPIKLNQRQPYVPVQNRANSTLQPGARRSFFCRIKSGRIWPPSLPKPFSTQPSQTTNYQDRKQMQHRHAHRSTSTKSRATKEAQDSKKQARSPSTQAGSTSPSTFSSPFSSSPGSSTSGSGVARSDSRSGEGIRTSVGRPNKSAQELDKARAHSSTPAKHTTSGCTSSSGISSAGSSWQDSLSGRNENSKRNKSESSSSARKDSIAKHQKRSDETSASNQTTSKKDQTSTPNCGQSSPLLSSNIASVPPVIRENQAKDTHLTTQTSQTILTRRSKSSRVESTPQYSPQSRKQWRYIVMHCTGYLKSITLRGDEFDDDDDESEGCESDSGSNSADYTNSDKSRTVNCLVAVCRRSVIDRDLKPDRPLTFTCRYSMEGKFVFVDQRTTVALGYTPQQLIGTSHYAYCHKDSVNTFKECHRQCILKSEAVSSDIYQFKRANGQHMWLQTSLKSFRNPWTKFIDYIVANHTTAEGADPRYNEGCVPTKFNQDMTCENLQSASPASTSSISSPSAESKKSSSPSSSSIESSYSMESYASGTSIQAVLNQIDRVKSGGIKHALDFSKSKHTCDATRSSTSGSSSARKSNDDSGNFSDMQSCSSISSNNSASPADYLNSQTINQIVSNQAAIVNITPTKCQRLTKRIQTVQQQQQQQQDTTQTSCPNGDVYVQTSQQRPDSLQQSSKGVSEIDFVASNKEMTDSSNINQQHNITCMDKLPVTTVQSMSCTTNQRPVPNQHTKQDRVICSDKSDQDSIRQVSMNQERIDREHQRPRVQYQRLSGKTIESNRSINNGDSWLVERSEQRQIYQTILPNDNHNEPIAHRQGSIGNVEHTSELCANTATEIESSVSRNDYEYRADVLQTPLVIVPGDINLHDNQISQIHNYPNELLHQVETYMTNSTNNQDYHHSSNMNIDQVNSAGTAQPIASCDALTHQAHIPSSIEIQQTRQSQSENQHQNGSGMMIWNSAPSSSGPSNIIQPFQNILPDIMPSQLLSDCQHQASSAGDLISMDIGGNNSQMIAQQHHQQHQQVLNCPQCAGHKCFPNQQMMLTNNHVDLNSLQLSSLAVDDLDENELLECLAACDPDSQLYNNQNSSYPQYNIYRD